MKNKILALFMSVALCFVTLPFAKPSKAQAFHWWWQTEVIVLQQHLCGTCSNGYNIQPAYTLVLLNADKNTTEYWYGSYVPRSAITPYFDPMQSYMVGCTITVDDSFLNNESWFIHCY